MTTALLHVFRPRRQEAHHVRQQHVSVLHLLALATSRRHVRLQLRQTCGTDSVSAAPPTCVRPQRALMRERQTNIVVEQLKTFSTNSLDLHLLAAVLSPPFGRPVLLLIAGARC